MTVVPLADPHGAFGAERERLLDAFATVLDSGSYILGEQVAGFEREWAAFCRCEHAVGISSGTDALAVALRAVGVGAGDEVLVPAMTAVATWMAVAQIGARPVGVDVDAQRCAMDPELTAGAVGPRTRAIVAVHLYGQPADVTRLAAVAAAAGVPLVEDAAQAHGARVGGDRVGSLGAAAAFSFYPTKNLGAMGDAGAVTTSSDELAERVRLLREYGWRTRDDAELAGVNARLDELQAALLRVLLPSLETATRRRAAIAQTYLEALADIPELELPRLIDGSEPAWHLFVVRHPRRERLAAELSDAGVATAVHYAPPPPLNSVFRDQGWRDGDFPIAEQHAATALSLPLHPQLGDGQVEIVIEATKAACERIRAS